MAEKLLRLAEVAISLGVSKRTLTGYIATGQLEAYKLSPSKTGPVRIAPSALASFLLARRK